MSKLSTLKFVKRSALQPWLKNWQLYILLLLPLTYLIVFKYYPMYGAQIAFRKFALGKGMYNSEWIGLAYIKKFINSQQFALVMKNTLILSVYSIFVGFPLAVIFAVILNSCDNLKLKKFTQMVTYSPHFISDVVLVGMLIQFLHPRFGLLNMIIQFFGGTAKSFMADPNAFASIYVWSGQWQHLGWSAIIYIAALANVDPTLHEAAVVDGASKLQRIRHIDIPCILPTTVTVLILSAGQIMNVGFEKIFLMQNGMNIKASEIIQTIVYKHAIAAQVPNYSYATAIGLFNSVISFILILTVNYISKKLADTSLF